MAELEVETKTLNDTINLEKSYAIYKKIINKNLPFKFSYLSYWKLKQSKKLMEEAIELECNLSKENMNQKIPNYKKYKRGTIIQVDFGIGLGSEMSQIHFAIVLNNYDNFKNNILTVIPLTSQSGKFNLNLGTLIIDELLKKLELLKLNNPELNNNYADKLKQHMQVVV